MSCFSGNVSHVGNTRIFARVTARASQFLVYQMDYKAENELALILPLPTPPNAAPDAVRFIDLSVYPEFFADMENGFPLAHSLPGVPSHKSKPAAVNAVGSFDASFLPSMQDFGQLDARFRIADELWNQLPEYHDFGFAVFKLRADAQTIHPIALEFQTRSPQLLYFPTVAIRDGSVPAETVFDTELFCQARAGWLRSYDVAGAFIDVARAQGIVDANERVSRMSVQGMHPNSDILVGLRA